MADPGTPPDLTTVILTSTVVSAIVTAGVTAFLAWKATKRAGVFSAIRIATTLESFVRECVNQLDDHQLWTTSRGNVGSEQISLPKFPVYPDDIDWSSLPPVLSERALTLASEVDIDSRGVIRFMWDVEGPHETDTAVEETAKCGLKALTLAADLRSLYGFPPFNASGHAAESMNEQLKDKQARDEATRLAVGSFMNPKGT